MCRTSAVNESLQQRTRVAYGTNPAYETNLLSFSPSQLTADPTELIERSDEFDDARPDRTPGLSALPRTWCASDSDEAADEAREETEGERVVWRTFLSRVSGRPKQSLYGGGSGGSSEEE